MGYQALHLERMHLAPRMEKSSDGKFILNTAVRSNGKIRAELIDDQDRPISGFTFDDCDPIYGDHQEIPVRWKGRTVLPHPTEIQPIQARLELTDATLFAFDFCLSCP